MKLGDVVVEPASIAARDKYWRILSDVFDAVDPERLRVGMERLSRETLFFAIESGHAYSSVLFVTPITLAGIHIGGAGGFCTRKEYRGRGYERLVMERALHDTSQEYGALLGWTRTPRYFLRFGWVEMSDLFVPDPDGSAPMFFFHREQSRSAISTLVDLPREYF